MPLYENVFLARQDVSSQQVTSLTETFTNIITENGGQVPKSEYWGLRNLAYRIKKNRKAHYVLLNIDAAPAALQELERNMRINEDVIRYMTVRVDELEEEPSIMMRAKAAREERSRRDEGERDRGRPASGRDDRPARALKDDGESTAGEAKPAPEASAAKEGEEK
jgi:small subunit ribosomal protein S6